MIKPINFDNKKRVSIKNALQGEKRNYFYSFFKLIIKFFNFQSNLIVLLFRDSNFLIIR